MTGYILVHTLEGRPVLVLPSQATPAEYKKLKREAKRLVKSAGGDVQIFVTAAPGEPSAAGFLPASEVDRWRKTPKS